MAWKELKSINSLFFFSTSPNRWLHSDFGITDKLKGKGESNVKQCNTMREKTMEIEIIIQVFKAMF